MEPISLAQDICVIISGLLGLIILFKDRDRYLDSCRQKRVSHYRCINK